MAREIRAPKEIADACDGELLVDYARDLSGIVARYTSHTEQHVLECVMRVVGHLCATGGDAE